jgi:hypothetical protein
METKWEHEMGCVCCMREAEEKCLQLFGCQNLRKEITWKNMYQWKDNIKTNVKRNEMVDVDFIYLLQVRDKFVGCCEDGDELWGFYKML